MSDENKLHRFPNYAGKGAADGIDDILDAELKAAGLEPAQRMETLRGKIGCEIETVSCSQLGAWFFQRYWCYWVAKGPGIPPDDAMRLWEQCGSHCRVAGDCTGPSPLEYYKGFGVGSYHIDTTEGLKALADTIKAIYARNTGEKDSNNKKHYRRLKKGEIVLATDEVYDDAKKAWVSPTGSVGGEAPDPAYTAHRQFRREIPHEKGTTGHDE